MIKLLFCLLISQAAFANSLIKNEDVKSLNDIKSAVLTTTGNIALGNVCLSSLGSVQNLSVGLYIYDVNHPSYLASGTTIVGLPGICSSGQVQMSAAANNSSSGDTFTFGGSISQLINDSKIYVSAN